MISFQNNLLSLLFFNVINKTPDSRRSTAAAAGREEIFFARRSYFRRGASGDYCGIGHFHNAASQVISLSVDVVSVFLYYLIWNHRCI